ncbi:hypothetical protein HYT17_02735 [Candidatus Microgenomates bacterium]|nr:hypothetical protein [Candidatus Microgenomates bacterium]
MLTKTDLSQIRKIIREEVENEAQSIKDELRSEIKMSMIRTHSEIKDLKDKVKNLEIRITRMHNELKKEIRIVADFLDRDHLRLQKRVQIIEHHIGISPS